MDPNAETSKQTSSASKQQTILLLQTSRHGIDLFASMRRGLSFCENLPCALALQTKRLVSAAPGAEGAGPVRRGPQALPAVGAYNIAGHHDADEKGRT